MFEPHQEPQLESIDKLCNHAQAARWSVEDRIDWQAEVQLPPDVPAASYVDMVSQLYYAEEATLQVCARMVRELPELTAKRYVCTQMADESRHIQAYQRYLARLGDIAPVNERLKSLFVAALESKGDPTALVVALNLVMENEAMDQQKRRIDTLPCPLFSQINRAILVDEARHSAFGTLYLRGKLPLLQEEQRHAITAWIESLWGGWMHANDGRYTDEGARVLAVRPQELSASWGGHQRRFRALGLIN